MAGRAVDNAATHRQLVRLAHDVLDRATAQQRVDQAEMMELLKWRLAQVRLGWQMSGQLAAALESAAWQRSHRA